MRSFGSDHPKTLGILNDLAETQAAAGDYESALESRLIGFNISTNLYGLWSVQTASAVFHLAEIHMLRGEYGLSRTNYELAILGWQAHLGDDDLRISTGLNHLGILSWEEKKHDEALALLRRALDLRLRLLGHPDPPCVGMAAGLSWLAYESGKHGQSLDDVAKLTRWNRRVLLESTGILSHVPSVDTYSVHYTWSQMAQSLLLLLLKQGAAAGAALGAHELASSKALVEEVQAVQAMLEKDSSTATKSFLEQGEEIRAQMTSLQSERLTPAEQETRRRTLLRQLEGLNEMVTKRLGLSAQSARERETSISDLARALASSAVLCDLIFLYPIGSPLATNGLPAPRYAAYLTFPLAKDSTNVVVERVDLGEAAPIDEAVELLCRRMGAGQFRAKDLEAALQRVSELVYAPLARHLTNVSHLIVCPDGQLSRVPFEMLLVSGSGGTPRYLVEEKTVSYVGSGREVARLAQPSATVKTNAPVVMGNPDFDFALPSRSRREEDLTNAERGVRNGEQKESDRNVRPHPGQEGSIPSPRLRPQPQEREIVSGIDQGSTGVSPSRTKFLSRSYRGIKFTPLPGSEQEARGVAKLLGGDTVLRIGKEAREAELKAVVSPRVLHVATHGFFLTDQEFKRTNAGPGLLASSARSRRGNEADLVARLRSPPPHVGSYDEWENPMVRCGIALAGANHAARITNAVAEDGLLTGLEASLLNLQGTELVILSACESGAGEVKIGEGVMSLRRAFRIAGAETVLASHWKVSDEATSRLMTEFMRRWRAGEPRAKAWREAQLALRHSEKFSHPYFWAAFTLTGQWR